MNRTAPLALGFLIVVGSLGLTWKVAISSSKACPVRTQRAATSLPLPTDLGFEELLAPGPKLRVAERATALQGKRVRLVGYMANLELAPLGAFYLSPISVICDEAGNGTAELPLTSVLVTSKSAAHETIQHIDGVLEVTGQFEVGRAADSAGRTTWFRLRLDADDVPQSVPESFAALEVLP